MRGSDEQQHVVFSYIHLGRSNSSGASPAADSGDGGPGLADLWTHFAALYARRGRPSIPPERLVRALLLQLLYSIRSETQLMEQLDYNLLYRWFVGLNPDEAVWDVTVFTKNRERLMAGEVSQRLLEAVLRQAGETRAVERGAFHGGRDADPGLGQSEEFCAQARAAGARQWLEGEEVVAGHA